MRRPSPLVGIFITIFLDLMGFGMFIPDIQVRADILGARGPILGLVIAIFSIAQFIVAPILGRWSDTIGRRKILVVTTLLSVMAYLVYSQATELWVMFVSRALLGMAGANIGIAYAYVADVTEPQDRAKGMGMIGAAFGLGFILGPALGSQLVAMGHNKPFLLGVVGAGLALVNFAYVLFFVPEPVKHESGPSTAFSLEKLKTAIATPGLGLLLALFFAYSFSFSNMESTFFRLAIKRFHMDQRGGAIVLVVVGIVAAVVQGGLMRSLTPKFGELKLMRMGYLLVTPALALMPFAWPWAPLLLGAVALGLGNGVAQPSLSSLISRNAPATMQGGIFGVTQGLGAFARIFGPMVGNALFEIDPAAPYFLAGTLMLIPIVLSWKFRPQHQGLEPEPVQVES